MPPHFPRFIHSACMVSVRDSKKVGVGRTDLTDIAQGVTRAKWVGLQTLSRSLNGSAVMPSLLAISAHAACTSGRFAQSTSENVYRILPGGPNLFFLAVDLSSIRRPIVLRTPKKRVLPSGGWSHLNYQVLAFVHHGRVPGNTIPPSQHRPEHSPSPCVSICGIESMICSR